MSQPLKIFIVYARKDAEFFYRLTPLWCRVGILGILSLLILWCSCLNTSNSDIEPEMVHIPGGTFRMGSNDGGDDEKPPHRVTVSDFYMGKYEVTNAEYCIFLNEKGNQKTDSVAWLDLDGNWGILPHLRRRRRL